MSLLIQIATVILIYLTFSFAIPALIIPNLWFNQREIKITSNKLKQKIKELNKIKDDEKFVKEVFLFVANRYNIAKNPISFLANLSKAFWHNPNKIIEKENELIYCPTQNNLIKLILLESKRFKKEDIETKITFALVIHQYLKVKIKNKRVILDPWAYDKGIPYGSFLNIKTFFQYMFN